jgi:hypothetical protein
VTRRGQVHSKREDLLGVDALALVSAYVIQILLIWIINSNGLTIPLALHPFNGSLILVIALVLPSSAFRQGRHLQPDREPSCGGYLNRVCC